MCFSSETTATHDNKTAMGSSKSKTSSKRSSSPRKNSFKKTRPRTNHACRDIERQRKISEQEAVVLRECRVVLNRIDVSKFPINNRESEKSESHKIPEIKVKEESEQELQQEQEQETCKDLKKRRESFHINLTQPARRSPRVRKISKKYDEFFVSSPSPSSVSSVSSSSSVIIDHGHGNIEFISPIGTINFTTCSVHLTRLEDERSMKWRQWPQEVSTLSSPPPPRAAANQRKVYVLKKKPKSSTLLPTRAHSPNKTLSSKIMKGHRSHPKAPVVNRTAVDKNKNTNNTMHDLKGEGEEGRLSGVRDPPKRKKTKVCLDELLARSPSTPKSPVSTQSLDSYETIGPLFGRPLTASFRDHDEEEGGGEKKRCWNHVGEQMDMNNSKPSPATYDWVEVDFIKYQVLGASCKDPNAPSDWDKKLPSIISRHTVDHNFTRADWLRGLELIPLDRTASAISMDEALDDIMEVIIADQETASEGIVDRCSNASVGTADKKPEEELAELTQQDLNRWLPPPSSPPPERPLFTFAVDKEPKPCDLASLATELLDWMVLTDDEGNKVTLPP